MMQNNFWKKKVVTIHFQSSKQKWKLNLLEWKFLFSKQMNKNEAVKVFEVI